VLTIADTIAGRWPGRKNRATWRSAGAGDAINRIAGPGTEGLASGGGAGDCDTYCLNLAMMALTIAGRVHTTRSGGWVGCI